MRDGAGPPHHVVPRSTWQQQQGRHLQSLAAAARSRRRYIIIILPHYTTIIAHFSLLVKLFAHFLADAKQRPFCPIRRLSRLICFHRREPIEMKAFS